MSDIKMKPCPFCGNQTRLDIYTDRIRDVHQETEADRFNTKMVLEIQTTGAVKTTISCACGCTFVTDSYRPIEAWNKRYYEEKEE